MNSLSNLSENIKDVAHVGVVILNWNGLPDLLECLPTVLASTYNKLTVIVVDNGSNDETGTLVPRQFPNVVLITTGVNLGWAGGNNVGIKHALNIGCDYVFLLNNDTTISFDCIEILVKSANGVEMSLMHPCIYYYDEPTIAQLDPLANSPGADRNQIIKIDYAYGAALLVNSKIFERIGLIDERFFLQMEETDFFYRAKKVGINSYVAPSALVLHKESRSFGGKITPVKSYYIIRNSLLLILKHAHQMGGWKKGLLKLYWTISKMIQRERHLDRSYFIANFLWLFKKNPVAKAICLGITDFLFGQFGALSGKKLAKINSFKKR